MRTLQHFNEFVKEITSNGSKKFKQSVLQKYKDDEIIHKYLKINFDPYTRYGISAKKLYKEVRVGECLCPLTVFDLFDYLTEHNTGRDYDVAVCQIALEWLAQDDTECAQLLELLICKDLNLGVDAKSINAVMPELIPTFNVQLAQKYFEKPEKLEGKYFALTTKIDGGRIIAIRETDGVSFFTRAGQRYEGLVDLEREMLETFPEGTVLDGEITILNDKGISVGRQMGTQNIQLLAVADDGPVQSGGCAEDGELDETAQLADHIHALYNGRRMTGSFDVNIAAVAIGQCADLISDLALTGVKHQISTEFLGFFQTVVLHIQNDQQLGVLHSGIGDHAETQSACAGDDNNILDGDLRAVHRMLGAAVGFDQQCLFKRHILFQVIISKQLAEEKSLRCCD